MRRGRYAGRPGRALALGLGLAAVACGGDAADATDERLPGLPVSERVSVAPPVLAPEVDLHMNRGNAAFEIGDPAVALQHYEAALEVDSTEAAAWFGVWMSLVELDETERADEVRSRLAQLGAPGVGDPHAAPQPDISEQGGGA